jgi:ribonucleoside-triphosphate reductase (thioredoxin)
MPYVAEKFFDTDTTIKVMDSKIGWATGFRQLISLLYGGLVPKWDLSAVRAAGAILKTFGGRASGPEPLDKLFHFTVTLFKGAAGRKLNSLECHDLMCMIADVVVSGGVRRSAMLSLSNLSDDRMRNAKNGKWYDTNDPAGDIYHGGYAAPWRALANNSVAYTEKPDLLTFLREWGTLYESKSGERGLFNRIAAHNQAKKNGRRKWQIERDGKFFPIDFGTNPCGEIILRPQGFCNLTEIVCRPGDTKESLKRKVRLAVILGTLQSTLTDFRYLRAIWKKNAEEERLLGVSMTGIKDCPMLSTPGPELEALLDELREYAISVNKRWAKKLGINESAAITCNKPSGTVSQLVDSSSGIHDRWSDFIDKTIREDVKSPITAFLKSLGVPWEADLRKPNDVAIFHFPIETPRESVKRNDRTAIQQLELYLCYKQHWTEHNPSCTIHVREHEWLDVAAWVFRHFNEIGGISFLPHSDHVYKQAPYTEIDEAAYLKMKETFPVIDWSKLQDFEREDFTTSAKELACSAGVCEI